MKIVLCQEQQPREAYAAASAEHEREERELSGQTPDAEHVRHNDAEAPQPPEDAARLAEVAHGPGEAVVDPEQIRRERLAAAQETAQRRREEKARKAALAQQRRRSAPPQASATIPDQQAEPPASTGVADPYAEFREAHDRPRGPLRLLPLGAWAHVEQSAAANLLDEPSPLHGLIAGLSVPADVAVVSYPHGCRIRRVRVRTIAITDDDLRETVIVSDSALDASRALAEADYR